MVEVIAGQLADFVGDSRTWRAGHWLSILLFVLRSKWFLTDCAIVRHADTLSQKIIKDKKLIEQVVGDLLDQDVDVIVNAANEHLQMGGGVAGAIRRADGSGKIQAECDAYVEKNGLVPTGGAALTTGGDLGPVIHAVGPVYNPTQPEQSRRLLYSTYTSALEIAERHDYRTIAFPYLSTGIFGYPLEEGIEVALEAAHDYLKNHPGGIDLIRFVSRA